MEADPGHEEDEQAGARVCALGPELGAHRLDVWHDLFRPERAVCFEQSTDLGARTVVSKDRADRFNGWWWDRTSGSSWSPTCSVYHGRSCSFHFVQAGSEPSVCVALISFGIAVMNTGNLQSHLLCSAGGFQCVLYQLAVCDRLWTYQHDSSENSQPIRHPGECKLLVNKKADMVRVNKEGVRQRARHGIGLLT